MENLKIKEGDIGLFEFQIKRGVVDENEIEDDDVQSLVDKLKNLCSDNKHKLDYFISTLHKGNTLHSQPRS